MANATRGQSRGGGTAKKARTRKEEFIWSDDECELLLSVTHEYKVKQLLKGTDWESVRSKYVDIVALYKKELLDPAQASQVLKDYPHTKEEITKEIVTSKLKAIRTKFRQVHHSLCVCLRYETITSVSAGCRLGETEWAW